jgi:hypothetical protein
MFFEMKMKEYPTVKIRMLYQQIFNLNLQMAILGMGWIINKRLY